MIEMVLVVQLLLKCMKNSKLRESEKLHAQPWLKNNSKDNLCIVNI